MSRFLGRYDHQMDEKGRVSLPAAFREEEGGGRFILIQWDKPFLTLFPLDVWGRVQNELMDFRGTDRRRWNWVRQVLANAVEVSPDKHGRILIPAFLQEAGSLKGTVVLNGVLDRIEVWDPEDFQAATQDTAEDSESFRLQIFGGTRLP